MSSSKKSTKGLSILYGAEGYVEHNFLHRVFEQGIPKYSAYKKPALIYQGEKNFTMSFGLN